MTTPHPTPPPTIKHKRAHMPPPHNHHTPTPVCPTARRTICLWWFLSFFLITTRHLPPLGGCTSSATTSPWLSRPRSDSITPATPPRGRCTLEARVKAPLPCSLAHALQTGSPRSQPQLKGATAAGVHGFQPRHMPHMRESRQIAWQCSLPGIEVEPFSTTVGDTILQ